MGRLINVSKYDLWPTIKRESAAAAASTVVVFAGGGGHEEMDMVAVGLVDDADTMIRRMAGVQAIY